MAIKRDALDALFSDLIRERNNWNCENCSRNFAHDTINLHCAHIVGRRVLRLRHDPINALALCSTCHHYFTDRPLEFSGAVKRLCGDAIVEELQRLSNEIHKRHKAWKKEARVHYREEGKAMKAKRMAGDQGYIEFVGYW